MMIFQFSLYLTITDSDMHAYLICFFLMKIKMMKIKNLSNNITYQNL